MDTPEGRRCPFCQSEGKLLGRRGGRSFLRCQSCRSIFEDVDVHIFEEIHQQALGDTGFLEDIVEALGTEPDTRTWLEFEHLLPGERILEIGPGTGHLLAAARSHGRDVSAVEHSEAHRNFISTHWGIESVYASLEELPPEARFDSIVGVNVLEHIYEVLPALRQFPSLLTPGGRVLISTVNAEAIVLSVVGTMWSMFKPADHVSFPTRAGLIKAARTAGLAPLRVWSSELPFETPVSLVVAARDFISERRAPEPSSPSGEAGASGRRLARWLYSHARAIDPTSRLLGRIGRAGTIKALLTL